MNILIAIPARYGSTRFPGKPLTQVCGLSMLERVWKIANSVSNATQVIICTEDDRILAESKRFGAEVYLTSESCRNGTERIVEAVKNASLKPDIVINLQGDAILTPPWIIESLINSFLNSQSPDIATTAVRLEKNEYELMCKSKEDGQAGGTFVVTALSGDALYFSKSPIPYLRDKTVAPLPLFRHIGLYGFRYETLINYSKLPPTPLEKTEGLEQLRALEHGIPIRVVEVDYRGRTHWSIDSHEDVKIVEKIIREQGELI